MKSFAHGPTQSYTDPEFAPLTKGSTVSAPFRQRKPKPEDGSANHNNRFPQHGSWGSVPAASHTPRVVALAHSRDPKTSPPRAGSHPPPTRCENFSYSFQLHIHLNSTEMAQRVTYRRQTPYNTRSNKIKVVKTPGGKLVAQHVKKQGTKVKCGDCGSALQGIASLRPRQYAQISKTKKTVQRAYGGSRCAGCVKERIIRAFLIEEQKIVKRVLKEQQQKEKDAAKN